VKRRIILITGLFLVVASLSDAQIWKSRRWEGIAGIGTANYFGDIGGFSPGDNLLGLKDYRFLQTRPSMFLGIRYKVRQDWAVKLNLTYGFLHGNDKRGSNENRGYEFSTNIFEPSLQAEYSFMKEKMSNNYLMMKGRRVTDFASHISMYGFAGLGTVFFSPKPSQAVIDRVGTDYTKVSLVLPIGIGIKLGINPVNSLAFEMGGRFTTSDYIDGFTSKFSKFTDVYYYGVFHYIYKVKTNRKGWPTF
jgi:hypothetical protein